MTDSEVVRLARRICAHLDKVADLIREIEAADHPNATEIAEELEVQSGSVRLDPACIYGLLKNPEKWQGK